MILQELNLVVGDNARCVAGYPHKQMVVVECIKDFSEAKNSDDIINNTSQFIKTVQGCLLTSHCISSNWD